MHAYTFIQTRVLCDRKSSATVHQLAIYRAINQFKSKQLSAQITLKIVREHLIIVAAESASLASE